MTFRFHILSTALGAAALAVGVGTALVLSSVRQDLEQRVERELTREARLAAEMLSHRAAASERELDGEADALGAILSARVTFIAADGRVVGDSDLTLDQIAQVENHTARPEVVDARRSGIGIGRRYSTTIRTSLMYVAIPISNPRMPLLAFVRLAVPLTDIERQLSWVRSLALLGFGTGMVAALALAWTVSAPLMRRLRAIQQRARKYAEGDLARPVPDYADDEIGAIARTIDAVTQDFAGRLTSLEADRARLEAILTGMVEGVLVVNEHGRLQLANDAARRMLRIDDAVEGRHYPEIVRHPAVATQIAAALAGRSTEGVELTGLRDPFVTLIARTAPVGRPPARGAVVVLHDISDLKRADQIRRDFVANVSHELRTPLTAVRGYVEALADASPDESRRFLDVVSRHTLRMERLVRDLLRLARLDAGQESLERVPCSIEGLFSAVEADLAPIVSARAQTLQRLVAPEAASVTGDPAKLQDAIRNLVENATNYSPEGSTIVIRAERRDARILITVADEGPGIPEADLPRVFERFYRVDKSRTRNGRDPGGTGLGLAIVKHLIELHGGRVMAANRAERGALFTIELAG